MRFGSIDQCIFFGGGQLLAEMAVQLRDQGYKVLVVTSQRHGKETVNTHDSLLGHLHKNNIEVIVSDDVNKDEAVLCRITPQTLGISLGAAWIFRKRFIERFGDRLINLHGTRLPQDRGGGGFSWRILRADRIGMSLIHQIDPGVDTGTIIAWEDYLFPSSCRLPRDYEVYAQERYKLFLDQFFQDVKAGKDFPLAAQPEYLSAYWPRLSTDAHGYIDWSWRLRDLELFICAFDDPYPGAMTFISDMKVRIQRCYATSTDGVFHPFQKGILYRISKDAAFVATEDGTLVIERVCSADGVDVRHKLAVGDRFFTPGKYLEQAKRNRAVYTPQGLGVMPIAG